MEEESTDHADWGQEECARTRDPWRVRPNLKANAKERLNAARLIESKEERKRRE